MLTGVDITSYGRDLPGDTTLGGLVRQVLKLVPELARLRLSSIDQVEADADLMLALAEEERLMPHLHLSMQSGDDLTLKRMKRRHSRGDAIAFCEKVARYGPMSCSAPILSRAFQPKPTRCSRIHAVSSMHAA